MPLTVYFCLTLSAAGIGDWMGVISGLPGHWAWRTGLAVLGGVTYFLSLRLALRELGPFIGGETPRRVGRAARLMLVPYATGALLYLVAGFLNPAGPLLVAVSAAASSLGGTSGLAWGFQMLRDPGFARAPGGPEPIPWSWPWVLAAAAVALPLILILGPGIRFGG